jgi:acyl-CoA synthetase (AMP-forming)/AMP-acid ligase II
LLLFHAATKTHGLAWGALAPVYGLAEATLAVSMPSLGVGPQRDASGQVCLGTPLQGMEVRADSGVLSLRGRWMLDAYVYGDGYVDPKTPDGWFETSDSGAIAPDGQVTVAGRVDSVIVVRGRNIHAEDVEAVACRAATGVVGRVAAFCPPGRDDVFCVAVEIADGAVEPEDVAGDIRVAVTHSLGIGLHDIFVGRSLSIPATTSGKPIRARCRELVADGEWPSRRVVVVHGRRPARG